MKFIDNIFTVRIRLNTQKTVSETDKELIFDSLGQRRFNLYQKWLNDCKKSGLFEKSLDGVEIPAKCPKLTTLDVPEFEVDEIQDITKAPNIMKQLVNLSYLFYKTTLLGEVVPQHAQASTAPTAVRLSKETEQLTNRVKMMQRNQLILFGLLAFSLLILLFQKSPARTN